MKTRWWNQTDYQILIGKPLPDDNNYIEEEWNQSYCYGFSLPCLKDAEMRCPVTGN